MIRSNPFRFTVVAVALVAAGCVPKPPTEVNPAFVPEGKPSPEARLVAYADLASTLLIFDDTPPFGPDMNDQLRETAEVRRFSAGANHLLLFDGTAATAFEVFRRESGGGFYSFKDFLLNPSRKWIDGQREIYTFTDDQPSGFTPPTYLLRGVVGGQVTTDSPLSNVSPVNPAMVTNIIYRGIPAPSDSLFNIRWDPVAGAAGYWIQVYQFAEAQTGDQILSGVPAPGYFDKSRDFFLGFIPAPATQYKLGSGSAGGMIEFTRRTTLRGQSYMVRVSAVDGDGRLMAYTFGDFGVALGEGEFTLFPLGSNVVSIQVPTGTPASAHRTVDLDGIDAWLGDLPVVRRESLSRISLR